MQMRTPPPARAQSRRAHCEPTIVLAAKTQQLVRARLSGTCAGKNCRMRITRNGKKCRTTAATRRFLFAFFFRPSGRRRSRAVSHVTSLVSSRLIVVESLHFFYACYEARAVAGSSEATDPEEQRAG
ncbi:hypothetical protein O0L34_g11698 [Tuta absoluta]|nr:hypothetical protein O0L34_g11698 [Tuta absoluta]